jgi:hypothetical protein
MAKITVLRLGTVCVDKATELSGTLTHWLMGMDCRIIYLFQPRGLDENGLPIKKLSLERERLEVKPEDYETVDVPFEILGSIITSKASGFTGMGVEFVRHINSCFHVVIQPKGLSPKTKEPVRKCDFDLRECEGEKINNPIGAELEQSKAERPSPTGDEVARDLPHGFDGSV